MSLTSGSEPWKQSLHASLSSNLGNRHFKAKMSATYDVVITPQVRNPASASASAWSPTQVRSDVCPALV